MAAKKKSKQTFEEMIDAYGLEDQMDSLLQVSAEAIKEKALNKDKIIYEIRQRLDQAKEKIIHKACGVKKDSMNNLQVDEYYYGRIMGITNSDMEKIVAEEVKPVAAAMIKEALKEMLSDTKYLNILKEQAKERIRALISDHLRYAAAERAEKIAEEYIDKLLTRKIKKGRARMHGKVLIKGSSEEVPIVEVPKK